MINKRSLLRRSAGPTVAASAAFVLAACGNGNDASTGQNGHEAVTPSASAPASQGQHNAADVAFAKGMIPHHRQGIEMAGLASSRAQSAEVKKLAADTKTAQGSQITTLTALLPTWGEQVPAEGDHSGHDMAGTMSPQEMEKLKNSSGAAFDTAFMELMIKHHQGAVEMAKTEKAQGVSPDAKTAADAIVASHSAEIEQMNKLLGRS
ncbi:DUF305 domain-containing protein [Streptomyces venezuelae]|uniref:DUF305 domain-containing protein n=1 Tax=Streptomyces venezuelae TaxID=54571 RepID=UPI00331D0CBC